MANGLLFSSGNAVNVSSGVVSNAIAAASMPAVPGMTNYLTGFEITGGGATLGSLVTVTVAGLQGGTMHYVYGSIAGVLLPNQPLLVRFTSPLPASGPNVAITVSCPALGLGNTANAVCVHGFVA